MPSQSSDVLRPLLRVDEIRRSPHSGSCPQAPCSFDRHRKALVPVFRASRDRQTRCRTGSSALVRHTAGVEEVALAERRLFPLTGVSQIPIRPARSGPPRADSGQKGRVSRLPGTGPSGKGRVSSGETSSLGPQHRGRHRGAAGWALARVRGCHAGHYRKCLVVLRDCFVLTLPRLAVIRCAT